MSKSRQIEVVFKKGLVDFANVAAVLLEQRLYKTLSLHKAAVAGVPVLPSLLLVERNDDIIRERIEIWGLPVMLRMDYSSLPKRKPLGGLPLYTVNSVFGSSKFLWKKRLYPLLQRNVMRISDIYSVGVLLENTSDVATIEVVGPGFDASDLRLGSAAPQEYLQTDLRRSRTLEHQVIEQETYKIERTRRLEKIQKFELYVEYVNERHKLLSSLDSFSQSSLKKSLSKVVPKKYSTIPKASLQSLLEYCRVLQKCVVRNLPVSTSYVASFSLVRDLGDCPSNPFKKQLFIAL